MNVTLVRQHMSKFVGPTLKGTVFMAAVIEYLCTELIEIAGQKDTARITPSTLSLAIQGDPELSAILHDLVMPQ